MKTLNLNKIDPNNEINFDELYRMLTDIDAFTKEDINPNNKEWVNNFNTILNFQEDDGSFKLFTTHYVPSDARVEFCHMPTYMCTAFLMKIFLIDSYSLADKVKPALIKGLTISCARNLQGHGYEGFRGQIDALNIFINGGLREFLEIHGDLCPEFSQMIKKISSEFNRRESLGKFYGAWGESYEEDILRINKYFSNKNVFVYGTLMLDEANHSYLSDSSYQKTCYIEGYDMYDVGYYPAIIPGENMVVGELYQVPNDDMAAIDTLEGEGVLYHKKCEIVNYGENETDFALIYVYGRDVEYLDKINSWKDEYVWYLSYGSNMLKERFMNYIEGGSFEETTFREPCIDTSKPIAVRTFEVPYDMYFGNSSLTWGDKGVSFLDVSKEGRALGVAYLITKTQFEHIAAQENCGRFPDGRGFWYEDIVKIGEIDGCDVITVTNKSIRPYNGPSRKYRWALYRGIKENWPEMSRREINDYLNSCKR